jgi:hypothetical protein
MEYLPETYSYECQKPNGKALLGIDDSKIKKLSIIQDQTKLLPVQLIYLANKLECGALKILRAYIIMSTNLG